MASRNDLAPLNESCLQIQSVQKMLDAVILALSNRDDLAINRYFRTSNRESLQRGAVNVLTSSHGRDTEDQEAGYGGCAGTYLSVRSQQPRGKLTSVHSPKVTWFPSQNRLEGLRSFAKNAEDVRGGQGTALHRHLAREGLPLWHIGQSASNLCSPDDLEGRLVGGVDGLRRFDDLTRLMK